MGKCRPWVNVAMGICRMGICRMGICRMGICRLTHIGVHRALPDDPLQGKEEGVAAQVSTKLSLQNFDIFF